MKPLAQNQNLLALSLEEMEAWCVKIGLKRYRAKQIFSWLYQHNVNDMHAMTNISEADRSTLLEKATLGYLNVQTRQKSSDGTEKFLLALDDGNRIESVWIPEPKRLTVCVSTQAGCTLDCKFCRTAEEKFTRNLTAAEIVGQLVTLQKEIPGRRITNVVFMGMGEPLANLPALTEALKRITAPFGLSISPRRITVSTAGLVPKIREFLAGPVPANLSISLNATTDTVRDQIMPRVNRLYPLQTLQTALRALPLPSRCRVTFEYVLLQGVNDSAEDAKRLVRFVHGIRCKINLIPFNAFPSSPYRCPPHAQIVQFAMILQESGLAVFTRKTRGQDILAACGQLRGMS